MKPSALDGLTKGEWDPIGQLLDGAERTKAVSAKLPYLSF